MYKKFILTTEDYCYDNLYFDNKYQIVKIIRSAYLYHPFFKKLLRFEFTFIRLLRRDKLDHLSRYEGIYQTIIRGNGKKKGIMHCNYAEKANYGEHYKSAFKQDDFTEELEKYCIKPDKQTSYFYQKVFHKENELPVFFSALSNNLPGESEKISINVLNFDRYNGCIESTINSSIEKGIISPETLEYYKEFTDKLNYVYEEYLVYSRKEKAISYLKKAATYLEKFKKDYFLYVWAKDVIYSFCYEVMPGFALICEHCGQVMTYARGKKYCTPEKDGRTCGVKARSNRANKKRKTKHIVNK